MQEAPLGDEYVLPLDCWNKKVMVVEHSKKQMYFHLHLDLFILSSEGNSLWQYLWANQQKLIFLNASRFCICADSTWHFVL